jgi:formylglycine-generating enzyme required for sulfatase activity
MIRANDVCIDATEVTAGQYAKFVLANPGALQPQDLCSWNTSFVPSPMNGDTYTWPPSGADVDYPVQYVDWCDAVTYCKWAGKELCGAVKAGDTLTLPDVQDPYKSQWVQACSRNAERTFPYSDMYEPFCAMGDIDAGGPHGVAKVHTFAGCQGGYAGMFDMLGNVLEWFDYCDSDATDSICSALGGDIATTSPSIVNCGSPPYPYERNSRSWNVGFRCCARP